MVLDTDLLLMMNMQKLADYIGLPCRIARGCRYCKEGHQSSCLVKIDDDKKLSRFDSAKDCRPPRWLFLFPSLFYLLTTASFHCWFQKLGTQAVIKTLFDACYLGSINLIIHLLILYVLLTDGSLLSCRGLACVCP